MKAAVLKEPKRIDLAEVPMPKAEPGFALVKVHACGVCGSDLRYFMGENPWALHTLGYHRPNPPNIILGHEFAGTVVDVGNPRDRELLNKRVAVLPYQICGTCHECLTGNHHLCAGMIHLGHAAGWKEMDYYPGGMAEYCPVWAEHCFEIPENLSFEMAACIDFVGVALHAVKLAGALFNKTTAVFGCGPIGNSICQLARSMGASRIFAVDVYEKAFEVLRSLGFSETCQNDDRTADGILEKTDQRGVNVVWDTVGTRETVKLGMSILDKQGILINLATHDLEINLNLKQLGSERMFRSSSNYRIEEFQETISIINNRKIDLSPFLSHTYPLDNIKNVFELLLNKKKSQIFKAIMIP